MRWRKYIARYENMMRGFAITEPDQLIALLLHFGGEDLYDIYDNIPAADKQPLAAVAAHDEVPAQAAIDVFRRGVDALTRHFTPRQNTEYQKYEFRHLKQNPGETLEKFVSRLRALAATCEFAEPDSEIKSQVISGCQSQKLRRKGLSEPTWDLTRLIDCGRAIETSDMQAKDIERATASTANMVLEDTSVNSLTNNCTACGRRHAFGQCRAYGKECNNCGGKGHFALTPQCPARGKMCPKCSKPNHLASKCRGKAPTPAPKSTPAPRFTPRGRGGRGRFKKQRHNVRSMAESEPQPGQQTDDSDYTWSHHDDTGQGQRPMFKVSINDFPLEVLADSGATCNIMSLNDYQNLAIKPPLQKHNKGIFAYGQDKSLDICGKFIADIVHQDSSVVAPVIVVKSHGQSVLSWDTSKQLRLIDTVNVVDSPEIQALKAEYKDIFTGVGKLKGVKVKLHVDPDVKPVAQHQRRVPFHVRKEVDPHHGYLR